MGCFYSLGKPGNFYSTAHWERNRILADGNPVGY